MFYNAVGMESNFTDLKTITMEITDEQIKELKTLLWVLDSKHNVSVPQTQENINYISGEIVKLFSITDVSNRYYLFSGQENGVKTEYLVDDCLDKEMAIAKIELEYFHFKWVMVKEFNGC